jgi:NAD dependent epimerase/dehydratase family
MSGIAASTSGRERSPVGLRPAAVRRYRVDGPIDEIGRDHAAPASSPCVLGSLWYDGLSIALVLITGGAGFIGSHAAIHFANAGRSVRVLDNLSRGALLGKPNRCLRSTGTTAAFLRTCQQLAGGSRMP